MSRESTRRFLTLAACLVLAGCLPHGDQLRRADSNAPVAAPPCVPVPLVLTPGDVLRMSTAGNGLGDALRLEAGDRGPSDCLACRPSRKQAALSAELQGHASDEIKNKTAGLALTAYFRLAEARAQMGLLRQGLEPIGALLAQAEELRSKGVTVPDDSSLLPRQRSELEANLVKIGTLQDSLAEQLHRVVGKSAGLPPCSCSTITTVEVFQVEEAVIDEADALAVGMKFRPDLNLLRCAMCNLDASTLPVIRRVMLGLSSLLAGPVRRCIPAVECVSVLLPGSSAKGVEKVARQLRAILDDRERQAISEIRQAARAIPAQHRLIRLARERQELARRELDEAEENARVKRGKPGAVPLARQSLLKAQGDVVHEVIAWEIARVDLRKAQGLLVREAAEAGGACAASR